MSTLPYDVARCQGYPGNPLCEGCLRRTPGHPTHQWMIAVPELNEDGSCDCFETTDDD